MKSDRREFWIEFMNWLRAASNEELVELETLQRNHERKIPRPLAPASIAVSQEVRRRVRRLAQPGEDSR